VARRDAPVCALTERLGDVRERVHAAGWETVVVVNEDRVVLGLLRAPELAKDGDLSIEDAMRPGPSTYRSYVPIKEVADRMSQRNQESSPITTSDGKLVGVLFKADALREAASS
jgi:predicted transcriptional regulator